MITLFSLFLLVLLVITAIAVVQTRDLFGAVMLLSIFSLLLAANFFLLDAADVALTEAAIGAGISTVLFLGALALTGEREAPRKGPRLVYLVAVIAATAVVIYATFDKPAFGDPQAPVQTHVGPWYLENTPEHIGIPNVVTAVLGAYRGYDTLGEVFVVFTAGIGVLFLLASGSSVHRGNRDQKLAEVGQVSGLRHYIVPRVVGRLLVPFILLFGLYVQFHGEYGPGGGFQAGAFVAAAIILYSLLEGEKDALEVIPRKALMWLICGGALLYGSVGVAGMLMGGNFLDYSVLLENPVAAQQFGIIVIELGVGLTVTGVLLGIYHSFAARGRS